MLTKQQQHLLQEMDISLWQTREQAAAVPPFESVDDWAALQQETMSCTRCALCKTRTTVVFGVGNPQADLVIIGEAPGANEDRQGEPFVGRAGQLLDAMLAAIDLKRQDVYICNILKCRPPNNRDPLPEEVATCTPFLERQIAYIKPKLVLAVGRIAAHYLLGVDTPLGKLRGKHLSLASSATTLIVTYHPAYLLRNPRDKAKAWQDLAEVRALMGG